MDKTEFIKHLASRGGPEPSAYQSYTDWVDSLRADLDAKLIDEDELSAIRAAFGDALSVHTMQGFALAKPHGYAGDFEIIDRIYRLHTADQPHLKKWDIYFHAQAAPTAVRNRKRTCVRGQSNGS